MVTVLSLSPLTQRHISDSSKSRSERPVFTFQARPDCYQQTPEQEILAFQKQLQNLPDLDSPNHALARRFPTDCGGGFATATGEFAPVTRPRSRSMPRVAYESSRYLTLPDSFPFNCRLPRGRSAGTLGFQVSFCSSPRRFSRVRQCCVNQTVVRLEEAERRPKT